MSNGITLSPAQPRLRTANSERLQGDVVAVVVLGHSRVVVGRCRSAKRDHVGFAESLKKSSCTSAATVAASLRLAGTRCQSRNCTLFSLAQADA